MLRKRRGFIRFAILHLLNEEPMHGYQIMKELEARSNHTYSASAGTIYPALQELLDQQLITLDTSTDKKIYTIDTNGKKQLQSSKHANADFWTEWQERMTWRTSKEATQLRDALDHWEIALRKAMKQTRGNRARSKELIALIEEMTNRLENNH